MRITDTSADGCQEADTWVTDVGGSDVRFDLTQPGLEMVRRVSDLVASSLSPTPAAVVEADEGSTPGTGASMHDRDVNARTGIDAYAVAVMEALSRPRASWLQRLRSRQVRDRDDPDHGKTMVRMHTVLRELRRLDRSGYLDPAHEERVLAALGRTPDQLTAASAAEAGFSEPFFLGTVERVARLGAPAKDDAQPAR